MRDLTTRFLLVLFKKALIWARFEFALRHYLKFVWKPFLLLKYLLNLFPLNGYCYGVPGGKQGTVGKEKGIRGAYGPMWGKMRCHPFKARYLKRNSWINPVK